jgi:hypothetical protein
VLAFKILSDENDISELRGALDAKCRALENTKSRMRSMLEMENERRWEVAIRDIRKEI